MRIGVDAFPLCPHFPQTGIPRAVREILLEMQRLDRENEYYLYSKLDFDFPLRNPRWHKCLHPGIPYLLGANYVRLRQLISRRDSHDLDAFWLTRTHAFPLGLPAKVARILTVYDLVWLLYPETMDERTRSAFDKFAGKGIRRADAIVAISESTRQGLIEKLGARPDKIRVVHLGVDSAFSPHERTSAAQLISVKYGVSPDYICAVGTIEPRKNITTLIEAVRIMRDRGQLTHQLLIAGGSGWNNSSIYACIRDQGLGENAIKFLGRVPDNDLSMLYSGSAMLVFPSVYEGFGLPLVEAMACGTPVVASNFSSIPEVVGDAGVLVSPKSAAAFADAIIRVLDCPGLRESLVAKGLRRARDFTWTKSAQGILRILQETSCKGAARPTEQARS